MLKESDLRFRQQDCIDFCSGDTETMIFADVGTGKTVIALTAFRDWCRYKSDRRALVLAPKRVCTDVWAQEIDEWEHLKDAGFTIECAAGKPEHKRREIIEGDADIALLNYENYPWLAETYPKPPFNFLICDEIDKLKDRTTYRFKGREWIDKKSKKVRSYEGMKKYRKHFETVIGLTGTPTSNHLMDIWPQVFIVDGGASLGKSFNAFKCKHFYQTDYLGYQFDVLPGHEDVIHKSISPITYRIEREDDIPPVIETPPRFVELSPSELKQYKKFEREYLIILESGENIESPHAAAAYGKLRQFANGFAYTEEDEGTLPKVKNTVWFTKPKYTELDALIGELQGQQLMVVYHFKSQLDELRRRYKDIKYLGGGVSDKQASKTIAEWNSGELGLLALHPMSAGHGLNLQKSGAHHIVMLTQPESAGLHEQVIGRLRRTGNTATTVFVHRILTRNTVDIEQDLKVHNKVTNQAEFLAAMRKRCN